MYRAQRKIRKYTDYKNYANDIILNLKIIINNIKVKSRIYLSGKEFEINNFKGFIKKK